MSKPKWPSLSSSPCYRDPKAALEWLEAAFGFEPVMVILGEDGSLVHSQMRFGDGMIMVGAEWSVDHHSPANIDGKNTQTIHVQLESDLDGHCERARAAGAEILAEPETQLYGDRTYRARDLEGHIWTFGETVEVMSTSKWEKAAGVTSKTRL
jgi:uncharacterized glyoxalase superfamily protein PhnB